MTKPKINFEMLKKPLLYALLSATLSLIATFSALIISLVLALKKARLKESLYELFPDYNWEHIGTYVTLKGITLKIYFDPGFFDSFPECASMLREKLIENSPSLENTSLEIDFLPRHLLDS